MATTEMVYVCPATYPVPGTVDDKAQSAADPARRVETPTANHSPRGADHRQALEPGRGTSAVARAGSTGDGRRCGGQSSVGVRGERRDVTSDVGNGLLVCPHSPGDNAETQSKLHEYKFGRATAVPTNTTAASA